MRPPVIQTRGLTVCYGTVTAVDRVDLTIDRGDVYALLGPNGAGKTTLVRALCGLVPIRGGGATVLGHDVARDPAAARASIGYMSQQFALYPELTARENIRFCAGIHGMREAEARRRQDELVALTGLEPYLDRPAKALSGGWKQRLALVCSLIHRPPLLFLDEPTAGIDPVARRELWDVLFGLAADGVTLVVSTHYMDEAERCSHVGYMQGGRLLAGGVPAALKRLPVVTPQGTRRLEIVGPDAAAMLARLRGRPAVREATAFGQAVHALVDADCEADDLGVNGAAVRPIEPSLEDVFVRLVRAQADAGAPAPPDESVPHIAPEAIPIPLPPAPARPARRVPSLARLAAVTRKEALHLVRDPVSLAMAMLFPILEVLLLSYSYDLNVRDLRTVVLDQSRTEESRRLLQGLVNAETFRVVGEVTTDEDLHRAIVAGRACVGFKIPEDYARRIRAGQTAGVLILVDGSDAHIANEAVSVSRAIGGEVTRVPVPTRPRATSGRVSRGQRWDEEQAAAVEVRPRILFNPDGLTPFFLLPGLLVVVCQTMAMGKSIHSVIQERDGGTFDLLRMTSAGATELLLGKLSVYLALALGEFGLVLFLIRTAFGLAIRGPLIALGVLSLAFLLAVIGYGMFLSTVAPTRRVAILLMSLTLMPTTFLSGLLLPLDSLPAPLAVVSRLIPATWLIDASRAVILRGTGWYDLRWHTVILSGLAVVTLAASARALRRRLR